jgi:hypothetical protein
LSNRTSWPISVFGKAALRVVEVIILDEQHRDAT